MFFLEKILLMIANYIKKRYKRILFVIVMLHIVMSILLSAAFVAIAMGEFGQPRFLEHNGCP